MYVILKVNYYVLYFMNIYVIVVFFYYTNIKICVTSRANFYDTLQSSAVFQRDLVIRYPMELNVPLSTTP